MQLYQNNIQDKYGNAIAGASVRVVDAATGALAVLYSDNGVTPMLNPITVGGRGEFSFYAPNGRYTFTATSPGVQVETVINFELADSLEIVAAVTGGAASAAADALTAETNAGLTALDRTATGADRTQTGQDRTAAADSATTASTQAGIATTKAGEALASKDAAGQSASDALARLNEMKSRSYGALAADPALDPLGNAPTAGDEYFNTTSNLLKRYNGTAWQVPDINTTNLAGPDGAGMVGFRGGNVANELATRQSALSNWQRGDIAGKKMAWVGDSTTYLIPLTAQNLSYLVNNYQSSGGPLAGVVLQWFGANGNSLANFVANAPSPHGINDVIASAPDLIVLSYGINDVRLGNTTQVQLVALLKTAINTLRAALPNCDIILRMPNSLLTTDVSGFGYVVAAGPAAGQTVAQAAQTYTDLMRNAYRALKNYWPNVVLYDAQESRYPEICPALSLGMVDQLHPSTANGVPGSNTGGFAGIIDDVVALAGYSASYSKGLAADAVNVSYADAHLTYPRVVENGDYQLVTEGAYVTQGSGFIRFSGEASQIGNISGGDILVQDGKAAITLPQYPSISLSGANIQIASLGTGIPEYVQTSGKVQVWRHKFLKNIAFKNYVNNVSYPFMQRVIINTGGTNFIRLQALSNERDIALFNLTTSDYLLHPDLGPLSLAAASFSYVSPGVLQINMTGNFAVVSGHYQCALASTGHMRTTKSNLLPIRFEKSPIAAATDIGTYVVSRGGYYSSAFGKLSAPLNPGISTVAVKKNGSTVATLSFAAGNMSATVAWAGGSGFTVYAGDYITFDITAGTGTADVSVVLDV